MNINATNCRTTRHLEFTQKFGDQICTAKLKFWFEMICRHAQSEFIWACSFGVPKTFYLRKIGAIQATKTVAADLHLIYAAAPVEGLTEFEAKWGGLSIHRAILAA